MCSPKWMLGLASWLIVGLVAFFRGLEMVGYPVVKVQEFMVQNPTWHKPIGFVVLLAGAYSLLTMVGMLLGYKGCRGCSCGKGSSCSCSN